MFQRADLNEEAQRMEANQASLSTAEGLRIRGFASQAKKIASTGQRNQKSRAELHKSCKEGDRSKSKLI